MSHEHISVATGRWWFQFFKIFTPVWGRFQCWPIFFKWVETTNQVGMYGKKTQATLRLTRFLIDWQYLRNSTMVTSFWQRAQYLALPCIFPATTNLHFPNSPKKTLNPFPPPARAPKKNSTTQLNKKNNRNSYRSTRWGWTFPSIHLQSLAAAKTALYYAWPRTLVRPTNRMVIPKLQQILGAHGWRGVSYQTKNTHRYFLLGPKFFLEIEWKPSLEVQAKTINMVII